MVKMMLKASIGRWISFDLLGLGMPIGEILCSKGQELWLTWLPIFCCIYVTHDIPDCSLIFDTSLPESIFHSCLLWVFSS
jgi:hypothetical protein